MAQVSLDTRLNKLAPAFSAKERALLVLDSLKNGAPEDPVWRHTMPATQTSEFNRYIGLMNVANRELSLIAGFLERMTREVELREAWLVSLRLWQEHVDEITRAVRLAVRLPITRSNYEAQAEKARNQWVPVRELAEFLAGEYEGWETSDWQETAEGEQEISDEAWDRVVAAKKQEVRAWIDQGSLPTRGKGTRLKGQLGAFHRLIGRSTEAVPDDYLLYRVVPDKLAPEVARDRIDLERLQGVLRGRPFYVSQESEASGLLDKIGEGLRETVAYDLISCWGTAPHG